MAGKPEGEVRSVLVPPSKTYGGYDALDNSPFLSPGLVDALRRAPRLDPTATIGGQRYRQVDNGRANVLVPEPLISPEQRAAIERAVFMANNPMAGAFYGGAALVGASPQARDRAMAVGAVADAAMQGGAPAGVRMRSPVRPLPALPPMPTSQREPVRYGPLTAYGQATGVNATVTRPMVNTGSGARPSLAPPGWMGDGREYNQSRGHLFGRQLGGTAKAPEEVLAIAQNPTNTPQMSNFEGAVKRRVRSGEVVEYFVNPLYDSNTLAPSWISMSADGTRGGFTPQIIQNPPPRRR